MLTVATVGDSMCVLSRGGRAVKVLRMHRLDNEEERLRVEKAGGTVVNSRCVTCAHTLRLPAYLHWHFYFQIFFMVCPTNVSHNNSQITNSFTSLILAKSIRFLSQFAVMVVILLPLDVVHHAG